MDDIRQIVNDNYVNDLTKVINGNEKYNKLGKAMKDLMYVTDKECKPVLEMDGVLSIDICTPELTAVLQKHIRADIDNYSARVRVMHTKSEYTWNHLNKVEIYVGDTMLAVIINRMRDKDIDKLPFSDSLALLQEAAYIVKTNEDKN